MSGTVRYICLPLIALSFYGSPASARDGRFVLNIAAGPLGKSLVAVSTQTGVAIGMSDVSPSVRVPALSGNFTVSEALRVLLRNTGFRARKLAPDVFRIERVPAVSVKRPPMRKSHSAVEPMPDIIVTGRKQTELLSNVPASISVYRPGADADVPPGMASTHDVARATLGLSTTNIGAGAAQLFIRGAADGPFLGQGQSTVASFFNDSRINFSGPDPDIRLIDVDRVEILRGPQGPLYGTGALGGVYRLVTRRPVLGANSVELQANGAAIVGSGLSGGGSAVVNLAVVPDKVGLRLVGYSDSRPGWITDVGLTSKANGSNTLGGRVGVRLTPISGWTLDVTGSFQNVHNDDSQYVYVDDDKLSRTVAFREPLKSNFELLEAHVEGPVGALNLTISSSLARHRLRRNFDANAAAAAFGVLGPALYSDDRRYRTFDQEVRLASETDRSFRWMAGFSYLLASSQVDGTLTTATGVTQHPVTIARQVSEVALFGNVEASILSSLTAEFGARLFSNRIEDDLAEGALTTSVARFIGFTPSASLAWHPAEKMLLYLRYASAIRPGGLALGAAGNRYDADEMRSLDLGLRMQSASGKISLDMSAFRSTWNHVQSNYLLENGLVSTHNVGDSHDVGVEATVRWSPDRHWTLSGGAAYQRARLVRAVAGQELPRDQRMPVVPDVSFNLKAVHAFRAGRWQANVGARLWFSGSTRLSFDAGLDRKTPAYALIGLTASASRGPWTIDLYVENAANSRADTFALGNPFSVRTDNQYTPARPRTIGLSLQYRR